MERKTQTHAQTDAQTYKLHFPRTARMGSLLSFDQYCGTLSLKAERMILGETQRYIEKDTELHR